MTINMFDTVTVSTVPSFANTSSEAVAGYVDGLYNDEQQLKAAFPDAQHLSIAVFASDDADCLDVETGDATPGEAPGWVNRQLARGATRPCLYANASTMPAVVAACQGTGIQRASVRLWVAHYIYVQPAPPFELGADAVQWTDRALGRNLDQSICLDTFFGPPPPPPPPPDPYHYSWFSTGPFPSPWGQLNERDVVLHYDGARKHPLRYKLHLRELERQLGWLAARVTNEAYEQKDPDGKPSWDRFDRGWRRWQLQLRADGNQIAF